MYATVMERAAKVKTMAISMRIVCFAALLPAFAAYGLDLPIHLNFQLGFQVHVVPAPNDTSHLLGLVVATDKILTDKKHSLVVTGTITNYGGVPCDGVGMHFAVTSYIGTGTSGNWAAVEPSSIPPGGTARFSAHIPLDSAKPRFAMYTITAASPLLFIQELPVEIVSPAPVEAIEPEREQPDP